MVLKRRIPLNKTEKKYIGIGLKRLRKARNWSQHKLALECELNYRHIYKLENNISEPGLGTIFKLTKGFNLKLWEFMREIEEDIT